jgi:hypothetical protein
MGVSVLSGGRARYTQVPIVFFPTDVSEFRQTAEQLLAAEKIELPDEFRRNARNFLYCQLYRSSLSFEEYLADVRRKGYVKLQPFSWQALLPENSPAIRILLKGIIGSELDQKARLRTKESEQPEQNFFWQEDECQP